MLALTLVSPCLIMEVMDVTVSILLCWRDVSHQWACFRLESWLRDLKGAIIRTSRVRSWQSVSWRVRWLFIDHWPAGGTLPSSKNRGRCSQDRQTVSATYKACKDQMRGPFIPEGLLRSTNMRDVTGNHTNDKTKVTNHYSGRWA